MIFLNFPKRLQISSKMDIEDFVQWFPCYFYNLILGEVTSGTPSPTLGMNVAMAYVPLSLSKIGTELQLLRGKKTSPCQVTKMPFHPTNYVF